MKQQMISSWLELLMLLAIASIGGVFAAAGSARQKPESRLIGDTHTAVIEGAPGVENLRIVEANATNVLIRWNRPRPGGIHAVESYLVEVLDPERQSFEVPNTFQEISFNVTRLQPFQDFTIGVRSCTAGGSEPVCGLAKLLRGTTDAAAPSAPRHLSVTMLDDFSAAVKWAAPDRTNGRIGGYSLLLLDSSGEVREFFDGPSFSHVLRNLIPKEVYRMEATAHNYDHNRQRLDSEPITMVFKHYPPRQIAPEYPGVWISDLWIVIVIMSILLAVMLSYIGISIAVREVIVCYRGRSHARMMEEGPLTD